VSARPGRKRGPRRRSFHEERKLHPWPPYAYTGEVREAFEAREWERACTGRLTWDAYRRLPAVQQRRTEDPELAYWRNRADNLRRRDARIAHILQRRGRMRADQAGDTAGFYTELRRTPSVRCEYCGRRMRGCDAEVDHRTPLARGGRHERANLAVACSPCNRRKGTMLEADFRALLAQPPDTHRKQTVNKPAKCARRHNTADFQTLVNSEVTR